MAKLNTRRPLVTTTTQHACNQPWPSSKPDLVTEVAAYDLLVLRRENNRTEHTGPG